VVATATATAVVMPCALLSSIVALPPSTHGHVKSFLIPTTTNSHNRLGSVVCNKQLLELRPFEEEMAKVSLQMKGSMNVTVALALDGEIDALHESATKYEQVCETPSKKIPRYILKHRKIKTL
jgi:hypothetical protein